jgi:hypothetical protein
MDAVRTARLRLDTRVVGAASLLWTRVYLSVEMAFVLAAKCVTMVTPSVSMVAAETAPPLSLATHVLVAAAPQQTLVWAATFHVRLAQAPLLESAPLAPQHIRS